ncbi:hypothetical protein D3C73_1108970 [compost metagenome]
MQNAMREGQLRLNPLRPLFLEQAHEPLALRRGDGTGAGGDASVGGDEDAAGGVEAPGHDLQWRAGL